MAKLKGPLLSNTASGTFGPRLTFSRRTSGQQVRTQHAQVDYENTKRKIVRDAFRYAIILWNSMPANEKRYWTEIESKGYADV